MAKLLQKPTRLSDSLLWELQRRAYSEFGPLAWTEKGVPSYPTSNPLIARHYASLILAYLRELELDPGEPFYLFDLGAGSGKFAYLLLKRLLPRVSCKICYVMTDIAEKNIAFWKSHPYFQSYLKEGVLDFASFQHDQQEPLHLLESGKTLEKMINPCVLIANYFFDTIPQDCFRIVDHQLQEGKMQIESEVPFEDPLDPALLPHLQFRFQYDTLHSGEYYPGEPDLNGLLEEYRQQFQNATFLFPSGPVRVIPNFAERCGGRLLLLAGDQGWATEEQIRRWSQLKIAIHGSFSMEVDYHALKQYFALQGGVGWTDPLSDSFFLNFAGVLGKTREANVALAFEEGVQAFGSGDYSRLDLGNNLSLDSMLLLIKLGGFDPSLLYEFVDPILAALPSATPNEKERLQKTLFFVWEQFYPTCVQESYFVMNLGVILFYLEQYPEAERFFQRAIELGGQKPEFLQNLENCRKKMG